MFSARGSDGKVRGERIPGLLEYISSVLERDIIIIYMYVKDMQPLQKQHVWCCQGLASSEMTQLRSNFTGIQALQGSFCVLSTESFVHLLLTTGLTQTGHNG